MTEPAPPPAAPLFRAVLTPNRSLSKLGFCLVMAGVSAVSFAAGVAFMLRGAWPVFGFFGLDVLLIWGALELSYRSGRLTETVELSPERLVVRRVEPGGRTAEWEFQPYWLKVELDEPERHDGELALASHGKRLVIGAFLAPEERASFAHALREALARTRASLGV